jgi:hypothetical protein
VVDLNKPNKITHVPFAIVLLLLFLYVLLVSPPAIYYIIHIKSVPPPNSITFPIIISMTKFVNINMYALK